MIKDSYDTEDNLFILIKIIHFFNLNFGFLNNDENLHLKSLLMFNFAFRSGNIHFEYCFRVFFPKKKDLIKI